MTDIETFEHKLRLAYTRWTACPCGHYLCALGDQKHLLHIVNGVIAIIKDKGSVVLEDTMEGRVIYYEDDDGLNAYNLHTLNHYRIIAVDRSKVRIYHKLGIIERREDGSKLITKLNGRQILRLPLEATINGGDISRIVVNTQEQEPNYGVKGTIYNLNGEKLFECNNNIRRLNISSDYIYAAEVIKEGTKSGLKLIYNDSWVDKKTYFNPYVTTVLNREILSLTTTAKIVSNGKQKRYYFDSECRQVVPLLSLFINCKQLYESEYFYIIADNNNELAVISKTSEFMALKSSSINLAISGVEQLEKKHYTRRLKRSDHTFTNNI